MRIRGRKKKKKKPKGYMIDFGRCEAGHGRSYKPGLREPR